jgi:hypothetical protein
MPDIDSAPLARAAEYVLAALRRAAPTEKAGASWRTIKRAGSVFIKTADLGAWATNDNKRHPFWGHWGSGPKVATNWDKTERTHWADFAFDRASRNALDTFANGWLDEYAAQSNEFERG